MYYITVPNVLDDIHLSYNMALDLLNVQEISCGRNQFLSIPGMVYFKESISILENLNPWLEDEIDWKIYIAEKGVHRTAIFVPISNALTNGAEPAYQEDLLHKSSKKFSNGRMRLRLDNFYLFFHLVKNSEGSFNPWVELHPKFNVNSGNVFYYGTVHITISGIANISAFINEDYAINSKYDTNVFEQIFGRNHIFGRNCHYFVSHLIDVIGASPSSTLAIHRIMPAGDPRAIFGIAPTVTIVGGILIMAGAPYATLVFCLHFACTIGYNIGYNIGKEYLGLLNM